MDTENSQLPKVAETQPGIKRTSINVPESLWADLRIAAIRRDMTATDAVEAAIRLWVEQSERSV